MISARSRQLSGEHVGTHDRERRALAAECASIRRIAEEDHAARRIAIDRDGRDLVDVEASTRELAARWKVATATAAHALRVLIEEGLVHAKPRSGTVVSGAHPQTSASAPGDLSRERVTAAALEIADAEGLPALSIRGLAARLDTSAMSLYRYVRSKDELITLMTEAALGEERLPMTPPAGWRAQLELSARLEWRIFKRHPWLARSRTSLAQPRCRTR